MSPEELSARLRKSERIFRLLVDSVRDYAIFMIDPDGYVASWNDGAERIKGYTASEIIGKHFSVFYPQEAIDRKHPREELAIARRDGTYEEEGWRVRKDGSLFWANVVITAVYEGEELVGFAKVTRDLTERKKAEKEVLEANAAKATAAAIAREREWLQVTLSSIGDAVIATDSDGVVNFLNPVAQSLTGWNNEEAIGTPLPRMFNIVNEQTREPAENPALRALSEGTIVGLANHTLLIAKDGTEVPIDDSGSPIKDVAGNLLGAVLIFRDVSERKEVEKAERARSAAEAALAAKTRFLATVSHEVRTPMAGVIGLVEILCVSIQDESLRQLADTALNSCKRLLQILNDLLDASKLQAGKIALENRTFAIRPVIGDVVQMARMSAGDDGLEITSDVANDVPDSICGDELRLRQVLLNLTFNAVKFTKKGKVHVSARLLERFDNGAKIAFVVEDTGIGITPEEMANLFKPFEQAQDSTSRIFGGTGLGLSISRELVSMMQGEIGVESKPGAGSKFWVHIPFRGGQCPTA